MLTAYLTAALITAGIIIGMGPQNIFVIKQGIRGQHVFLTILMCELCEILTVSLGAFGLGYLLTHNPLIQKIIGIGGVLFLVYYGFQSFRAAFKKHDNNIKIRRQSLSAKEAVFATLSISLLNPWALMDTMVIVGGAASQYDVTSLTVAFVLGSLTISTIWFSAIGFGAKSLRHYLDNDKFNRGMDLTAGIVMWLAAVTLTKTMVFG